MNPIIAANWKMNLTIDEGLVLIDEIESITEPGAAANLIAGTLDYLRDRNKDVVLVTHLGSVLSDFGDILF